MLFFLVLVWQAIEFQFISIPSIFASAPFHIFGFFALVAPFQSLLCLPKANMLGFILFILTGLVSLSTAGYVLEDDYSVDKFFSMFDFFTVQLPRISIHAD